LSSLCTNNHPPKKMDMAIPIADRAAITIS
jgi:hypothetical protein